MVDMEVSMVWFRSGYVKVELGDEALLKLESGKIAYGYYSKDGWFDHNGRRILGAEWIGYIEDYPPEEEDQV